MNASFGNYLAGNIGDNSRVTYPGNAQTDTLGKDAWLNFPARVQTQAATSNPALMMPGSNLSAVAFSGTLAQDAGYDQGTPTGYSVGGTAAY